MSIPVTVIDYGIGNLLNVVRAFEYCGGSVRVINRFSSGDLESSRLVLPGVGAFGDGMRELRARGLDDLILDFAATGRPFLGICAGLQMMFSVGEEMGKHQGLGLLDGHVRPVPPTGVDGVFHRIPHIGWRALAATTDWGSSILSDLQQGERVYFVHSYAAEPVVHDIQLATVSYGGHDICAAVQYGNLHGCQFHPERSALPGLSIIKRFLSL